MKRIAIIPAAWLWFSANANAAMQPGVAPTGGIFQVLLGLILVLGLMAALAWVLKRFGATRAAGGAAIRVVGGVSVGGRERVLIIEAADQWIVVGVSPGRVNALATMPRQENAVPMAGPAAKNFSIWLKQTVEKRNGH
ncbi:MAG TPA: flagellar biosynthetic protein FliO [Sulfuriferula sp.]|nr:flagellar biosynthetic protein FliO [Sulfuriferula sp.]